MIVKICRVESTAELGVDSTGRDQIETTVGEILEVRWFILYLADTTV